MRKEVELGSCDRATDRKVARVSFASTDTKRSRSPQRPGGQEQRHNRGHGRPGRARAPHEPIDRYAMTRRHVERDFKNPRKALSPLVLPPPPRGNRLRNRAPFPSPCTSYTNESSANFRTDYSAQRFARRNPTPGRTMQDNAES